MIRNLGTKLLLGTGRIIGRFITVHTRPMYPRASHYRAVETTADARCAIVIQGPIRHEDDFTLETVKLYCRHYPASTIILSTWEGEDVSKFQAFEGKRFVVVKSEKPTHPAPGNLNFQIISSKAGADEAMHQGLAYTLKTRTDQRIYSIGLLEFLENILERFPVFGTNKQAGRIIGTASATSKIRNYQLSDVFLFGRTSDMQTYWNADLITDTTIHAKTFHAEGYLFKQFLGRTGWNVLGTQANFLQALGARCIIIDNELLDIYWPKYINLLREHRIKTYRYPELEISFKTWLNEAYMPLLTSQTPS